MNLYPQTKFFNAGDLVLLAPDYVKYIFDEKFNHASSTEHRPYIVLGSHAKYPQLYFVAPLTSQFSRNILYLKEHRMLQTPHPGSLFCGTNTHDRNYFMNGCIRLDLACVVPGIKATLYRAASDYTLRNAAPPCPPTQCQPEHRAVITAAYQHDLQEWQAIGTVPVPQIRGFGTGWISANGMNLLRTLNDERRIHTLLNVQIGRAIYLTDDDLRRW